ncbi:MAG: nucleotidyltransferase family protein [Myxococcales bacterium]|nr:nucleotidyltransferase family protein [Myxococcota bacterium]MDW8281252.1 nucleotidyltransferase family protein [Myxococcales bacterium]
MILAAGASRRMGRPKALLPVPGTGEPFLERIVRTARTAGVQALVTVVAPPHGAAIREALPALVLAWNPEPERGMLSSVWCGLAALPPGLAGVLLWPVDVPLVQPTTVQRLLGEHRGQITIPTYGSQGGHPIWIPADLIPAVYALPLQEGLRGLRLRHPERILRLPVLDAAVVVDVDTPDDLAALPVQPNPEWKKL